MSRKSFQRIFIVLLFLLAVSEIRAQYRSSKTGEQVTSTLNSILNGYDKRVRPNFGVQPVDVGITLYVLSIESVCEKNMQATLTFYFRQKWRDPRLKFTGLQSNIEVPGNELGDKIWLPDTFFVNQKGMITNNDKSYTRIHPDGEVLRAVRMTATVNCPMNLQYFPMDTQLCSIEIESFSSNMNDIRYNWASGTQSIGVSPDVSLPEWKYLSSKPVSMEISLTTGNYSRIAANFQFQRSVGYYIKSVYLPAAIFVLLGWVTFWISSDAMTSRVLTGVGSVVCLIQIWQHNSKSVAKISYIKAIDVYLISCIAMVFLSLIESALITFLVLRKKTFKKSMQNDISRGHRRKPCCLKFAPWLLDWFSRLVYPALFIGVNFLYWRKLLSDTNIQIELSRLQ